MHRAALAAVIITLLIALTSAYATEERLSNEKRTDITTLLEVTGALNVGKKMGDYVVTQMTEDLKENRPDIPSKMYAVLQEVVHSTIEDNLDELAELLIPMYHRLFSHDEIKGLLVFYRSDLGKKTIALTTTIAREGLESGRQWGRAVSPEIRKRVMARFKEHGYEM